MSTQQHPVPVEVYPAPGGNGRLTLTDLELFCAAMRAMNARDDAPVRGRLAPGGWLTRITAYPKVEP